MNSVLYEKFREIGSILNDNEEYITELYNLLPDNIKQSTIIKNNLVDEYLYQFGYPLKIRNTTLHGDEDYPKIKNLYLAIRTAKKYLQTNSLTSYINKIGNPDKHLDYLFEMRPLFYLKNVLKTEYESMANCTKNKNVDWLIEDSNWIISFDVKKRIKNEIGHLEYLTNVLNQLDKGIPSHKIATPQAPDPTNLFKNTISKFNNTKNSKTLQGAWISTGITEDNAKLEKYFQELDPNKIQFAIISNWNKNAYILVKDELYKKVLIDFFDLIESNDFVCTTYKL